MPGGWTPQPPVREEGGCLGCCKVLLPPDRPLSDSPRSLLRAEAAWWPIRACFAASLVLAMVVCVGLFEVVRISSYLLEAECHVLGYQIIEAGACTVCGPSRRGARYVSDEALAASSSRGPDGTACEVHPMAALRLTVTFRPLDEDRNATASVWHCKELVDYGAAGEPKDGLRSSLVASAMIDPCRDGASSVDGVRRPRLHAPATLSADDLMPVGAQYNAQQVDADIPVGGELPVGGVASQPGMTGPPPRLAHCRVGAVARLAERHMSRPKHQCFYNSRDPEGQPVLFNVPGRVRLDDLWVGKVRGYPVACVFGGMVFISLILVGAALLTDDRDFAVMVGPE